MKSQEVWELIRTRRSVRQYDDQPVDDQQVQRILEAAHWAPSGLNNQPWRFVVVRDPAVKDRLAELTHYGKIVKAAAVVLPVFIHRSSMYNATKDHQAMGACLQNMLLMAHGQGLGAVWLGEILKNAEAVRETLGVDADHELMAVVCVGHPRGQTKNGERKPLDDMILARL